MSKRIQNEANLAERHEESNPKLVSRRAFLGRTGKIVAVGALSHFIMVGMPGGKAIAGCQMVLGVETCTVPATDGGPCPNPKPYSCQNPQVNDSCRRVPTDLCTHTPYDNCVNIPADSCTKLPDHGCQNLATDKEH